MSNSNLLARTLSAFGFAAAAHALQHWAKDARQITAWNLYEESQGNSFLDMQGRVFMAPKMLTKKREYAG